MNKKILISLSIIGVVAAIAIGATTAFFSDVEESEGNTFTAGTLDLEVNDKNPVTNALIEFSDIKPGDSGSKVIKMCNTGTIKGGIVMCIKNLKNYENGCTEPEGPPTPDNTCSNPGEGEGELGEYLKVTITWDGCPPHEETLNSWASGTWKCIDGLDLNPGQCRTCTIDWEMPTTTGNIIQSDSATFDLEFTLTQE